MIDEDKIHLLNPDDVIDRPGFPRQREDVTKIEELAKSIKENGQIQPILITDKNELIVGGRRRAACKKLGIQVTCVYKSQVSDLELRSMELEENVQREDLTWHEKAKAVKELTELKQSIYGRGGSGKSSGWSNQSTADLIGVSRGEVSQTITLAKAIEQFPILKEAKNEADAKKMLDKMHEAAILTVLIKRKEEELNNGGVPSLFESSFLIGDAIEGLKIHTPEQFDFADVDTPYGIGLHEQKKSSQSNLELKTMSRYTEWDDKIYMENIPIIMKEVYRVLKPNGWALFWFGIEWYQFIVNTLTEVGFAYDKIPNIWYGGDGSAQTMHPEVNLGRSYDTFIPARKGQPALAKMGRSNVFSFNKTAAQNKIHPTEKPIELMEEIVKTYIQPGSAGVVPFLGSGNTLRALFKYGCTCKGWELDDQLKFKCRIRVEADKGA
jgi:ParB/RepB/Spo0J family partition protein